jgi:hypothetical protein
MQYTWDSAQTLSQSEMQTTDINVSFSNTWAELQVFQWHHSTGTKTFKYDGNASTISHFPVGSNDFIIKRDTLFMGQPFYKLCGINMVSAIPISPSSSYSSPQIVPIIPPSQIIPISSQFLYYGVFPAPTQPVSVVTATPYYDPDNMASYSTVTSGSRLQYLVVAPLPPNTSYEKVEHNESANYSEYNVTIVIPGYAGTHEYGSSHLTRVSVTTGTQKQRYAAYAMPSVNERGKQGKGYWTQDETPATPRRCVIEFGGSYGGEHNAHISMPHGNYYIMHDWAAVNRVELYVNRCGVGCRSAHIAFTSNEGAQRRRPDPPTNFDPRISHTNLITDVAVYGNNVSLYASPQRMRNVTDVQQLTTVLLSNGQREQRPLDLPSLPEIETITKPGASMAYRYSAEGVPAVNYEFSGVYENLIMKGLLEVQGDDLVHHEINTSVFHQLTDGSSVEQVIIRTAWYHDPSGRPRCGIYCGTDWPAIP